MSQEEVRRFNRDGIDAFEDWIRTNTEDSGKLKNFLKEDDAKGYMKLLQDKNKTEVFKDAKPIDVVHPDARPENNVQFINYLIDILSDCDPVDVYNDKGLWAWLSCRFFEKLVQKRKGGKYMGAITRWICYDADSGIGGRSMEEHRHLLRTKYRIAKAIPEEHSKLLDMIFPQRGISYGGEAVENLSQWQPAITNTNFLLALYNIFFDEKKQELKKIGITGRNFTEDLRKLKYDHYDKAVYQWYLHKCEPEFIVDLLRKQWPEYYEPYFR